MVLRPTVHRDDEAHCYSKNEKSSLEHAPIENEHHKIDGYVVGYSHEHMLMWRCKGDKVTEKKKEFSLPLNDIPSHEPENNNVLFIFADGWQGHLPSLANGSLREQQRARGLSNKGQPSFGKRNIKKRTT